MYLFQSSLSRAILDEIGKIKPDIKINVLRTFADEKNVILDMVYNKPANVNKIILDSGTYSIKTGNKKYSSRTKEDYKIFISNHGNQFDFVFNFDIDHSDEGTEKNFENQLHFASQNLNVIPVIQNLNEVDYFCENAEKYPLVAIGSKKMKDKDAVKKSVEKLYANGKIKVHLFGESSFTVTHDIPVYSTDSKSYIDWTINNMISFFDMDSKKEIRLNLNRWNKLGKENNDYYGFHDNYLPFVNWLHNHLNFLVQDLFLYNNLAIANSYYYWYLEQIITEEHKNQHFDFDE